MAPCAVRKELAACDEGSRRVLSATEAPRELAEAVEEDMKEMERELGATEAERKLGSYLSHSRSNYSPSYSHSHSHNYYYNDFWSRTERYCTWYTDSCFDFCDWYPTKCGEFYERFP